MLQLPAIRYNIKEIYFQKMKIKELVESRKDNFGYPLFDFLYNKKQGYYVIL